MKTGIKIRNAQNKIVWKMEHSGA